MRVVVVTLYGCFLNGSVHALDLAVSPRVPWLRHSLFDIVLITAHSKHMAYVLRRQAIPVAWWVAELAAVIGQDCVYLVRHCLDQVVQECC